MNNVIIQNASIADAPCISKVLLDSFIQFKSFYTPEAFAATTVSADEVLKRLKEGNVWVAVKDEHIIGTVAVVKQGNDLYIRGMAVLPEARGLQIGWKFLEHIQQYAVENNFKSLLLSTTPYLPSAIHLYKKFGFEQIGEVDNSFYGTLIFTMKKLL
ncbi:MAG: GNAT family N-acetyltransferase [Chitinophagaceae bacterium]